MFRWDAANLANEGAAHTETAMYVVVHEDFEYDSFTQYATKCARVDTNLVLRYEKTLPRCLYLTPISPTTWPRWL